MTGLPTDPQLPEGLIVLAVICDMMRSATGTNRMSGIHSQKPSKSPRPQTATNGLIGMPITHAGRVAPLKIGEVRILESPHEKRRDPTGRADHDAAQRLCDFLEGVAHEEHSKTGPHDRNRHDDE